MKSKAPPRNRLAKPLPQAWRERLQALGVPKRKYTAVCRVTLAGGRVIDELIVEQGWIVALDRGGLVESADPFKPFEQRIDFDPERIEAMEVLQIA